jgi:adenine-specific DNA-methyltransferase
MKITEEKVTTEITALNKDFENLKKLFPQYFDKDGNFDFAKFRKYLEEKNISLSFEKESYGLDWLGKSYARVLATDPANTLLLENKEHNNKPENKNSENILIKGDNLEVLKHLSHAYYEKVKMIYIDPPYNTGSDGFVYHDDRKYTVEQLQEIIGIDEERAKRILDFINSKSNSHSAWLTFMYPRLYIARQLLSEDGVIFVSIDDNEVAQLRLLMDEIFGEENFVANYKWNKTSTPPSLSKKVRHKFEYVICYEKKSDNILFNGGITDGGDMPLLNESNNVDTLIFPKESVNFLISGKYKPGIYDRIELLNEINIIDGKADNDIKLKGPFKWKQTNLDNEVENGTIFYVKSKKFAIRYERGGKRIKVPSDVISKKECNVGTNEDANKELNSLFNKDGLFNYPKPTSLLKYLINFKCSKNDIILDFFAGSGTTGDAVMQLNAEDGGNRKFILVQLPEPILERKNKTAYDFVKNELKAEPTIFEITKERLIRAAQKIKEEIILPKIQEKENEIIKLSSQLNLSENKEKIQQLKQEIEKLSQQDLGFKIFETKPIWEDYYFDAKEFDASQSLFDTGKLSEEDIQALLFTWKTYDFSPLTEPIQEVDLGGYKAFYCNQKLYLMYKGFTIDHLINLMQKVDEDKKFIPKTIIAYGYHIESARLRELAENLKTHTNKKDIDIDFIIRY